LAFTLSKGANYSEAERRVFSLLRLGEVDTKELTRMYYGRSATPENGLIIVGSAARSLASKVKNNRESFDVVRTERCGPYPIKYRLRRR
jgi:hypothetical protein